MIDLIPASHRTTTVCRLLAGMQDDDAWDRWPLLRDALMDADAPAAVLRDVLMGMVLACPADDEVRLAWADVVGGERAEFVRVQCELAPWTFTPGLHQKKCRCSGCGLRRREDELWDAMNTGPWPGFEWDYPADRRFDQRKRGSPHLSDMRRGFVARMHCSWSDWLTHHHSLYWSPRQRVECPECRGTMRWDAHPSNFRCQQCDGGRIPRPMVEEAECPNRCRLDAHHRKRIWRAEVLGVWLECDQCIDGRIRRNVITTAQPLEMVRLTTWDMNIISIESTEDRLVIEEDGHWYTFTRLKCQTCDGKGTQSIHAAGGFGYRGPCLDCHGEPRNAWECEEWPGLVFEMPFDE